MTTIFVVSCLTLALTIPYLQAAKLDNTLLTSSLCRAHKNGFQSLMPGSCSLYYECENGEIQLRSCPQYYDLVKHACVDVNPGCVEIFDLEMSASTACTGSCCGISNGVYVVDNDNSQIYYQCNDNYIVLQKTCSEDLIFDVDKQECTAYTEIIATTSCTTTTETTTTSTATSSTTYTATSLTTSTATTLTTTRPTTCATTISATTISITTTTATTSSIPTTETAITITTSIPEHCITDSTSTSVVCVNNSCTTTTTTTKTCTTSTGNTTTTTTIVICTTINGITNCSTESIVAMQPYSTYLI